MRVLAYTGQWTRRASHMTTTCIYKTSACTNQYNTPDVAPGSSEVLTREVETHRPHGSAAGASDGVDVLELAQIPNLGTNGEGTDGVADCVAARIKCASAEGWRARGQEGQEDCGSPQVSGGSMRDCWQLRAPRASAKWLHLDSGISGAGGQIVAILREAERRDCAGVALKIGCGTAWLLNVPPACGHMCGNGGRLHATMGRVRVP